MKYKSDLILLLAAIIWGFAFVAQRVGMDFVGPFTYNGVRFSLGVLVLLPFLYFRIKKGGRLINAHGDEVRKIVAGSIFTGLLLFGGVGLQQLGLLYTTAGKAGFLTGLYVVMVPMIGLFFGHRSGWMLWTGALFAVAGLYFLTIRGEMTFNPGDQLVLGCAVVFTFHVLFIGWLAPRMDSFLLAVIQFTVCAVLNLVVSFFLEPVSYHQIVMAWLPIAYGGILSVGVAYTLQVVAQKTAHPAYASIILSLEAVFAVLGGWMILSEELTSKMLVGCGLMLAGMIVVQVRTGNS